MHFVTCARVQVTHPHDVQLFCTNIDCHISSWEEEEELDAFTCYNESVRGMKSFYLSVVAKQFEHGTNHSLGLEFSKGWW